MATWMRHVCKILVYPLNHTETLALSMLEEHFFQCPYCWEEISMLLDLSGGNQSYVEDCEVCCNPITINYEAEDGALVSFSADPLQQ